MKFSVSILFNICSHWIVGGQKNKRKRSVITQNLHQPLSLIMSNHESKESHITYLTMNLRSHITYLDLFICCVIGVS